MDDFSDQISKILGDPQAMEQIKSMADMLGTQNQPQQKPAPVSQPQLSPEILNAVTKMMPLLGEMKQDDNSTRLLAALRPFLSNDRRQRLDEAARMLQMMRLLPIIKKLSGG